MRQFILIIFTAFSLTSHSQNIDLKLLKSINEKDYPVWDKSMQLTSHSIYPVMAGSVGTLLIVGYAKKDSLMIRNGYRTAVALTLNYGFTEAIKFSVRRKRPFNEYPDDIIKRAGPTGFSFPSGHSSSAFCTATALTLSTKKWYVGVPAYTYASLVAYSRMRLGVHYPSDVLVGALVGIGSGFLTWQLDKWVSKK